MGEPKDERIDLPQESFVQGEAVVGGDKRRARFVPDGRFIGALRGRKIGEIGGHEDAARAADGFCLQNRRE